MEAAKMESAKSDSHKVRLIVGAAAAGAAVRRMKKAFAARSHDRKQ